MQARMLSKLQRAGIGLERDARIAAQGGNEVRTVHGGDLLAGALKANAEGAITVGVNSHASHAAVLGLVRGKVKAG